MADDETSTLLRLRTALKSLFMEDAYIARVYYESMRDNFEGYDVTYDIDDFNALKADFKGLCPKAGKAPTLGELFRIEVALLRHLPDTAIHSRYWSIEDRFRRVVPASVADTYDRRTPPPGNERWNDIVFVRDQSRSLLDTIHANYLINLGREQSNKRLMFIIALAALLILGVGAIFALASLTAIEQQGMTLIMVSGMVGAMISIVNRLQKATSRDAMAQDGIFELIGLRTGWVSILMSICIGGVFALLLYGMVMGGWSDLILPTPATSTETSEDKAQDNPSDPGSSATEAEGRADDAVIQDRQEGGGEPGTSAETDAIGFATNTRATQGPIMIASAASAAGTSINGALDAESKTSAKMPSQSLPKGGPDVSGLAKAEKRWIERIAEALGFESVSEVYKMLVLAFLAGFAEQFVPDILNRLSKQGKLK